MATGLEGLEQLLDWARVNRQQRDEFRADPELAVLILRRALDSPAVRNPAAYALNALRAERVAPSIRPSPARVAELRESRLQLAALELAWSGGAGDRVLAALAAAIDANGGCRSLLTPALHSAA